MDSFVMQPGYEQQRSAEKRALRRGNADIRAPWIGPTIANGPLPVLGAEGRGRYVHQLQPRLALSYFRRENFPGSRRRRERAGLQGVVAAPGAQRRG